MTKQSPKNIAVKFLMITILILFGTFQIKSQNFQGVLYYEIKTYTKLEDSIISGLDTFEIHINEHLFSYRYFKDNRRFIIDYKKLLIYSIEGKKVMIERLDTSMPDSLSNFDQKIIEMCKDDSVIYKTDSFHTQFESFSQCGSYYFICLNDSSLEINQLYLNQTDPYGEYAKYYKNKIIKELKIEYFNLIKAHFLLINIISKKPDKYSFELPRRKLFWDKKMAKYVKFKS
jgi:hypothetical protein